MISLKHAIALTIVAIVAVGCCCPCPTGGDIPTGALPVADRVMAHAPEAMGAPIAAAAPAAAQRF